MEAHDCMSMAIDRIIDEIKLVIFRSLEAKVSMESMHLDV